MSLKVIGAGLGRTGTLSLKFALEYLGLGRCYHMTELYSSGRNALPLWLDAINGKPHWDKIFHGFGATTDYPGSCFYQQLMDYYPEAKVILTVRDADSWFNSITETIFSSRRDSNVFGDTGQAFSNFIRQPFGDKIDDREFMCDYFNRWNQSVIDTVPKDRLLVIEPGAGWQPLCDFLEMDIPEAPYPKVHARQQRKAHENTTPAKNADELEQRMQQHLVRLNKKLQSERALLF